MRCAAISRLSFQPALLLSAVAGLLQLSGCGGADSASAPSRPPASEVARVSISPDSIVIRIGDETQLQVDVRDQAGNSLQRSVSWSSSDTLVASVTSSGAVRGLGFGVTQLSVNVEGRTASARVGVYYRDRDSVVVQGSDTIRLLVGNGSGVEVVPQELPSGVRVGVSLGTDGDSTFGATIGPSLAVSLGVSGATTAVSRRASAAASSAVVVSQVGLTVVVPSTLPTNTTQQIAAFVVSPMSSGRHPWIVPVAGAIPAPKVGGTAVRGTAVLPVPGAFRVSVVMVSLTCPSVPLTARAYRADDSSATQVSANRAPLLFLHGLQPPQNTVFPIIACRDFNTFRPEADTWSSMIPRLFPSSGAALDPRLAVYEPWIMKYPTQQSIESSADELRAQIARIFGGRKGVIVAHSMGGLVAARYLTKYGTQNVERLITLGTPWSGSPFANVSRLSALQNALSACPNTASFIFAFFASPTPGLSDLSDAPGAYLSSVLRPLMPQLAPMRFSIFGEISLGVHEAGSSGYSVFEGGACLIEKLRGERSDGVVPVSSATAHASAGLVRMSGYDHEALTDSLLIEPRDPQAQVARWLVEAADRVAPVTSVVVTPAVTTLGVGTTSTFSAATLDVSGAFLTGHSVTWTSSDSTLLSIDATSGVARALNVGGPISVVARYGSITGQATVTVAPSAQSRFLTVSVGGTHVCALRSDRAILCWGENDEFQLGRASPYRSLQPPDLVDASTGATYSGIDLGEEFSCALRAGGAAECWGSDMGYPLGHETVLRSEKPTVVIGGHSFREIAAGYQHTCGLDTSGTTWCWGTAPGRQYGSSPPPWEPTAMRQPIPYRTIATGRYSTCALDFSDRLWCWGNLAFTTAGLSQPELLVVNGTAPTFSSVSLGESHGCVLSLSGEAYCWGANYNGILGDGTSNASRLPVRVSTNLRFASIAAGTDQTCARTAAGEAWCWGRITITTGFDVQPVPRLVSGGPMFKSVSVGYGSACGISLLDEVWCWGRNWYGELATGYAGSSAVPIRIATP